MNDQEERERANGKMFYYLGMVLILIVKTIHASSTPYSIEFPDVRLGSISQFILDSSSHSISFNTTSRGLYGGIYINTINSSCSLQSMVEPRPFYFYPKSTILCYYADSNDPADYNKIDEIVLDTGGKASIKVLNPIIIEDVIPIIVFTSEDLSTTASLLNPLPVMDTYDEREYGYIIQKFPVYGELQVNGMTLTSNQTIVPTRDELVYRPFPGYFNIASGTGGNPFLNLLSVPIQQCDTYQLSGCPDTLELSLYPSFRTDLFTNNTVKIHIYVEHVVSPIYSFYSQLDNSTVSTIEIESTKLINISSIVNDSDLDVEYITMTIQILPLDSGYVFFKDLTRSDYLSLVTMIDCPLFPEYASCSVLSFTGLPSNVNTVIQSLHAVFMLGDGTTDISKEAELNIEIYKNNLPSEKTVRAYSFSINQLTQPPTSPGLVSDINNDALEIPLVVVSIAVFISILILLLVRFRRCLKGCCARSNKKKPIKLKTDLVENNGMQHQLQQPLYPKPTSENQFSNQPIQQVRRIPIQQQQPPPPPHLQPPLAPQQLLPSRQPQQQPQPQSSLFNRAPSQTRVQQITSSSRGSTTGGNGSWRSDSSPNEQSNVY